MKLILSLVLATLFAAAVAVYEYPLTTIPYCATVTNGQISETYNTFDYFEYYCTKAGALAFAVFLNGQNTEFNTTWAMIDEQADHYWSLSINETAFVYPEVGVMWDLGVDDCNGGFGIIDGTYDAVDGGMSLMFSFKSLDSPSFTNVGASSSITVSFLTTTCGAGNTVSFEMSADMMGIEIDGLTVKRTFYFPEVNTIKCFDH
ncbi:hypothetical protein HW132_34895 [Brasilonema sp. CT11]|nr:hypothetical protein [Brasilonema sp. CT11]